jgi:hypothetical protein
MEETSQIVSQRGEKKMKKSDWQYLVDTLLFLSVVGIALIGFLMGVVIPKGPTTPESSKYFLGLHRHQWSNIHFYLSIAFVVFVTIHILFSWKWIKNKSRQIFKERWNTALISTAVASVLLVFLFWAIYPKVPGAYEDYGVRASVRSGQQAKSDEKTPRAEENILYEDGSVYVVITGQTTLKQAEKATGIPAKTLAAELGIPSNISRDDTFGRLRKQYGFSLLEVRDVISDLLSREAASEEVKASQEKGEIHEAEHEKKLTRGISAEDQSGILITGRMTFYDIGKKTGIPARQIAAKLNLPSNVSLDDTLGRLRRRYGFTIQDVREAIASLMEKK